jgi:hypothetical protein
MMLSPAFKLFMTWKRRYKAEVGATLKQQVEGEVTLLETDFKTYKLDMAAKKKAIHPVALLLLQLACLPPVEARTFSFTSSKSR